MIRSKRSNNNNNNPKSNTNLRTPNYKSIKNESKDASDIQEILSQLSRSVNLLERIVHDNVGKVPKRSPGKKDRRHKSPSPTASANNLESNAAEEEGKQRSLKAIEHAKTSDLEDEFNVEERNMLDVKIKSIISDPSFVFSCKNISARDMSVLKEVVFGMDTKALRLVTPSPQAGENDGKVDAGNEPGETTVLQVTEADGKSQMTEELPVKGN